MIIVRDCHTRGHTDLGWLDSRHTFSFGNYRDPEHMGFGVLRVINDDRVAPGAGFGAHSHSDMEIISYVLKGALEHKDSLGNGSVIVPGDVQRMSAGTGVTHSEYNASKTEPVHFLQIWIIPEAQGIAPGYEQKRFPRERMEGRLRLIADRWGSEGAVTVHQDVAIFAGMLSDGKKLTHEFTEGRRGWLHVARGLVRLNGDELREGDSAKIEGERVIELETDHRAEILLFDLT
ncbi:pirin family protein [Parasphingorhabdus sp.]|uniref:pirin family protein n=1 Tax=Parasphingorhabdus sp. TaxID=2709688 RepID=UPI002F924146